MNTKLSIALLLIVSIAVFLTGCGSETDSMSTVAAWSAANTTADTTRPTVLSVSPSNGATNVSINSAIIVTFSEPIDCTTATANINATPAITGNVTCSNDTVTITPVPSLAYGATYVLYVDTGLKDLAGNAILAQYGWTFTTATAPDNTPPTVLSTVPANLATNVRVIGETFSVTFSEPVLCATVNSSTFTITQLPATAVILNINCAGTSATTITATAAANYDSGFNYAATITTGVTDVAGNALATNKNWTFTSTADTIGPTVSSTSPIDTAVGVATSTNISVTFSEPIDCTTVIATQPTPSFFIEATLSPGVYIGATISSCSGSSATLHPSTPLTATTSYTVTVKAAITDAVGNPLNSPSFGAAGSDYTFSFTTL